MATTPSDPPPLVLSLGSVDVGMTGLVGGKAANLGRLIRAGLPVPAGFCVTTRAYREAVGDALDGVLVELAGIAPSDRAGLADLAAQARAALLAAAMPSPVEAAVRQAYRDLGERAPVAVRSSATAEDLPDASFAGQQDTYLNVVGTGALMDAVHRCCASLWTDRAVAYRSSAGIDHREVSLAVVVQQMVDADVAGVMFTANPVTGSRVQTVIDASPGLGEAVVTGAVNPDHVVVDGGSGAVLERRVGDKAVTIRARPGGGTSRVSTAAADPAFCLTDDQIRSLTMLGRQVSDHYGAPQDTEWAIDAAGGLWLTQARPITTLYPLPAGPLPDGLRVLFCFSVAQGLTRPLTPMGLSAIRAVGGSFFRMLQLPLTDPVAGPAAVRDAGGRLFFDITPIVRSQIGRRIAPRVLDVMEARSAVILRALFDDPRLSVVNHSRWPFVRRLSRVAARYRVPLLAAEALLRPDAAHRRLAAMEAEVRRRTSLPAGATAAERVAFVGAAVGDTIVSILPRVVPIAGVGFGMLALARRILGADASPGELQGVLRSLPHNATTEMDLDLWRVARVARADPEAAAQLRSMPAAELADAHRASRLAPALQDALAGFLARYGHRAVAEIDIGMPRWSQDPTHILGVLANYLRLDDPDRAPDAQFARGAQQAEALAASLTRQARERAAWRGWVVGLCLRRARDLAGLREWPKYLLVVALSRLREQLDLVGIDLARAGRLDAADDIFFLDLPEAAAAVAGRDVSELVRARRDAYARELRRRHVPRVMLSDGTDAEALRPGAEPADGALVGTPASGGTVTGPARVVLDPIGAHLKPGEILVAPSTDPGWTPLFLTAGGLVMEMGGAGSHGAVVAREYGIPAVVGVPGATGRLTTGQRITVDGSRGLVSDGGAG